MGFQFQNLDEKTRKLMTEEVARDISTGSLYLSPRLSERGCQDWPGLLQAAIDSGDEIALANSLRVSSRLNTTEQRRKPKGGFTTADVPVTAPETLAEGEFNRFYARALCRRAIEEGLAAVVVYRAKQVANARSASEALIGTRFNPKALLDDLQTHQGVDTALGLPGGPNSGLSVRLP